MTDYTQRELPEELTLDSVIRIGLIETTIKKFIQHGMVRQEGSRFIKKFDFRPPPDSDPRIPKPNPFSLSELKRRGFTVMAGKTEAQDCVMLQAGAYYRISDALKNGLLTETTQPYNPFKE